MTTYSPRIYVYKITFLEVLHYYYGVHLEKKFNECYMGSPVTHKDFWEFYTPIKEIIREFPYTDEGWIKANEYEKSLIRPVYNIDPLCLNENCGGIMSLDVCRRIGKSHCENGTGAFSLTKEQRQETSSKAGNKTYELGIGIHSQTKEQLSEAGKKGGNRTKELGKGVCGLSDERRREIGKKSGRKCVELGLGCHSLTKEELSENGKKYGAMGGRISAKRLNAQVWECTVTGHQSNPGALSKFQQARGINTTNRIRIQ